MLQTITFGDANGFTEGGEWEDRIGKFEQGKAYKIQPRIQNINPCQFQWIHLITKPVVLVM